MCICENVNPDDDELSLPTAISIAKVQQHSLREGGGELSRRDHPGSATRELSLGLQVLLTNISSSQSGRMS